MVNVDLPLFVYGALKSGEFAHRIVEPLLEADPQPARATGLELLVLDGVAFAIRNDTTSVRGEILNFKDAESAYATVSKFEDVPNFYVWAEIETNLGRANTLISADPKVKTRYDKVDDWTSAKDGLLGYGIPWAYARIENLKPMLKGKDTERDFEFWMAYHDLQSTYLLLWSITERILLFHDGPAERLRSLGDKVEWLKDMVKHPDLRAAVEKAKIADRLGVRSNLNPHSADPKRAGKYGFEAWYRVRNNVTHRGKSTRVENSTLLTATIDLHNTLAIYLQENSSSINELWMDLTSKLEVPYSTWLYKIQK